MTDPSPVGHAAARPWGATRLPNIDPELSRLVLGTMTFGDTVDAGTAAQMLDVALDGGITAVDTANAYAGGRTEEILAELLPGRRDRILLATKAGMPHADCGDDPPLSPRGLKAALEGSLARLQVDHVDLLYLHQPDRRTPLADTLGAVAELVTGGTVGGWVSRTSPPGRSARPCGRPIART